MPGLEDRKGTWPWRSAEEAGYKTKYRSLAMADRYRHHGIGTAGRAHDARTVLLFLQPQDSDAWGTTPHVIPFALFLSTCLSDEDCTGTGSAV